MNVIDKAISIFSPRKGLERIVARKNIDIINSGYGNHGGNTEKKSLKGWVFGGGSPDEDINDNLQVLRQRSRDLYMGASPIATGAIKTFRTNVVGAGLRLKPKIDYELLNMTEEEGNAWEEKTEKEFLLWSESKDCDAQRMNNFYELQQLVFLSQLLSGDTFVTMPYIKGRGPYGLALNTIEADRCVTPTLMIGKTNIKNGVEVGEYGEPVAYHFAKKHPLSRSAILENDVVRIKAYGEETGLPNVLHIMESERPGQTRGVPVLAPVIESLKQLGRYTEAELMAAVVSGMFTIFIETANDVGETGFGEAIPHDEQIDHDDNFSYEMGNGAIVGLAPGETANGVNPGRPNTAFDGFVIAISRQIGTALEIPYELLVKQFNASYSASRASLLEAWKMFKMRRTWITTDFCQPVYEQFLYEAIAIGRIDAPGFFNDALIRKAYCGSEWSGPTQGQIDPLKEVNAANKRVEGGFSTRERETIELTGGDFNKNVRQLVQEEKMMEEIRAVKEPREVIEKNEKN